MRGARATGSALAIRSERQAGRDAGQPGIEERYNATGSLYVCLTGLVHLGLPPDDPFWTARATDWTQKKIWSGQDVARGRALPTPSKKGK